MILGFYERLVIILPIIVLSIIFLSTASKVDKDRHSVWHDNEKLKLRNKFDMLFLVSTFPNFNEERALFLQEQKQRIKRQRYADLMEEILFELIELDTEKSAFARNIAYDLGFAQQSVVNLKKRSNLHIMHGCMQARIYLYHPAVPYLLHNLNDQYPQLQYSILLALSRFDDPQAIQQAFSRLQNALLVNERVIREIVNWLSPKNRTELFRCVLEQSSDALKSMFIKCMDQESALVFKDDIRQLFSDDNDFELRIAAIKAMAASKDHAFIPELTQALQNSNWQMRSVAAKGLAAVPDERVLQPLLQAICDSNWWVRQNAALTLLSFPYPESITQDVIQTNDRYAIDSLYYAAEIKSMDIPLALLQVAKGEMQQVPTTQLDGSTYTAKP